MSAVENNAEQMMAGLEAAATGIAWLTGLKRQFIDSGWSELMAEHMVYEMYRQSGATQ